MIEDRSEGLMMPPWTYVSGYPPVNAIVGKKEDLPNYLNDLNAMHQAEKVLNDDQLNDYAHHVIHLKIPCPDGTVDDWDLFEEYGWSGLLRATATQRAEAFLRTLNLWKE